MFAFCAVVDPYSDVDFVNVTLWVFGVEDVCDTQTDQSTITVASDESVTLETNVDGQGVDVYNAGTQNKPRALGVTIYGKYSV